MNTNTNGLFVTKVVCVGMKWSMPKGNIIVVIIV